MSFLVDLTKADDDTLVELASRAFRRGLTDGLTLSKPISSYDLIESLPMHSMRRFHRVKLRQVYGAGFDIAAINKRINDASK